MNDGGPAFPRSCYESDRFRDKGDNGMSLRDWFAGQAGSPPTEWLARQMDDAKDRESIRLGCVDLDSLVSPIAYCRAVAEWRYMMADAMLEARKTSTDAAAHDAAKGGKA